MHTRQPPWTSVPAARSPLALLQLRLYIIVGLLVAAAAAGVFAAIAWGTHEPATADPADVNPTAAGFARSIADSYVAGEPTPLPVAEGLSPWLRDDHSGRAGIPGGDVVASGWHRGYVAGHLLEAHTFIVTDSEGTMYNLTVPVLLDADYPVLAAYPSLLPLRYPQGETIPALEYQDVPSAADGIPAAVATQVGRWAEAYAADDTQALRDLTGDPNARVGEYRGLGGRTLTKPAELRAAAYTVGGYLVVRVRLAMSDNSANRYVAESDLDLLVADVTTEVPHVVAWGPVGSGPTLQPYGNRVRQ